SYRLASDVRSPASHRFLLFGWINAGLYRKCPARCCWGEGWSWPPPAPVRCEGLHLWGFSEAWEKAHASGGMPSGKPDPPTCRRGARNPSTWAIEFPCLQRFAHSTAFRSSGWYCMLLICNRRRSGIRNGNRLANDAMRRRGEPLPYGPEKRGSIHFMEAEVM